MIQPGLREQIDDAPASTGFGVGGTEYDTLDPRMHDRTGTHDTGLQGHVKRAIRQPIVAQCATGLAQGHQVEVDERILAAAVLRQLALAVVAGLEQIQRGQ